MFADFAVLSDFVYTLTLLYAVSLATGACWAVLIYYDLPKE